MKRTRLLLTPRDGLFLKDGRGWYTSDIGRSHSRTWPIPPTIRGALRAAYGHAWMLDNKQTLTAEQWESQSSSVAIHALLAMRVPVGHEPSSDHRVWPVPADAIYQESADSGSGAHIACSDPEAVRDPSVKGLDYVPRDNPCAAVRWAALWRPYHAAGKPASTPEFWPETAMMRWLRGDEVTSEPGYRVPRRVDYHVTIQADTETATPTMLFSTEISEPLERTTRDHSLESTDEETQAHVQWAMAADITWPGDITRSISTPLTIGGQRRLTPTCAVSESIFAAPDDLGGDSQGLRLILISPAEFEHGWLPDGFSVKDGSLYRGTLAGIDMILRAALVDRPLDLSTWNMVERRPRKTRRLVRPGAVYFFHKANREPFTAKERRELWLAPLGCGTEDGLGRVLPGCWNRKGT